MSRTTDKYASENMVTTVGYALTVKKLIPWKQDYIKVFFMFRKKENQQITKILRNGQFQNELCLKTEGQIRRQKILPKKKCLMLVGTNPGRDFEFGTIWLYIWDHYSYLPTPPLGQDMTHGQFLSGV